MAQRKTQAAAAAGNPRLGMLLLVTSQGLTAAVDAIAKRFSADLHGVQLTWGYFLMIFLPLLAYALARKKPFPETVRTSRLALQLGRSAMLVLTIASLFIGIAYIPFADAIAISFMAPLFISVLAVPMLGETLSYRRLGVVLVGLAGVIIVMRPGGGLHWAYFMPLLCAVFFALYQVTTRQLAATDDFFTTLFYTGAGGLFWVSLGVGFFWRPLAAPHLLAFLTMGLLGVMAHLCLIKAYAAAEATLLAPFNYTKIVWAVLLGMLLFGETPSVATWIGTGVIIASGLALLGPESRRSA